MRNYIDPEMSISKFSVTDVVTTSDVGVYEDTTQTNITNAKTYLGSKIAIANDIMDFTATN